MLQRKLIILFIILVCQTQAQTPSNIKSIQLKPLAEKKFSAIVPLGTILELSFDDLDADQKIYQYKIEHMTYDWKPSNLIENQYINGFNQNTIQHYENSFNTFQNYTHYWVQFPNNSIEITKSGNYLLSVINEDDEIIFTRKFVLYENAVTVGVSVLRSRLTQNSNQQQTVQFIINQNGIRSNNPSHDFKITILQNDNWHTSLSNIKPQFYKNNQLIYKHTNKTNFWGGNEFLNFDNKIIRNSNLHIAKSIRKEIFHNYLHIDTPRNYRTYTYYPDINGQFLIRTIEAENQQTEADYAMMHFILQSEKFDDKKIYVYGAFNNFETTTENEMQYDEDIKSYTTSFKVKQGFYNYNYVTINNKNQLNLHEISGSFYQTENEYKVIVYFSPFGSNYDRVIGVGNGFFDQNQ